MFTKEEVSVLISALCEREDELHDCIKDMWYESPEQKEEYINELETISGMYKKLDELSKKSSHLIVVPKCDCRQFQNLNRCEHI